MRKTQKNSQHADVLETGDCRCAPAARHECCQDERNAHQLRMATVTLHQDLRTIATAAIKAHVKFTTMGSTHAQTKLHMSKERKALFACLVSERTDGEARQRNDGGHSLSQRENCGAESAPFLPHNYQEQQE